MKGFIYKITSPSTDKIYVGSTIQSLEDRMKNHLKKSNHTRSREILIYGDAEIELIEEYEYVDIQSLREKENEYILAHKVICCNYKNKLTENEKKLNIQSYQKKWKQSTAGKEKKKRDKIKRSVIVNCPVCSLQCSIGGLNRHIKNKH